MTPLLSEALQEAYASASTEDVIVDTLEVVAGAQHLYLCRGFVAITLNDENGDPHVFQPVPFEFNLPGQDSTGAQTLNVGIENVDGTVAAFVQSALLNNTPIVVKYRSYLPNRLVMPPTSPIGTATLLGVAYSTVRVAGMEWTAEYIRYASVGTAHPNGDNPWGRMYTWDEANTVASLAGDAWRVPTEDDLTTMRDALGLDQATLLGLKESGTTHWNSPNQGALSLAGFKLLGSGYLSGFDGAFLDFKSRYRLRVGDGSGLARTCWEWTNNPGLNRIEYTTSDTTSKYPTMLVRDYTPEPVPDLNPQNPRPLVLTVTAAELTLKGVTFAASVADFVNQPFPSAFYSFTSFPGLR